MNLQIKDEVTVLLNDSSVCVIKDSDSLDLRDQTHDQSCFFPDSLAPGHVRYFCLHEPLGAVEVPDCATITAATRNGAIHSV